jgi:hypothetical protein
MAMDKSGQPAMIRRVVLFPNLYLWLVFVASIDIVLTRLILFFSGSEINPVAAMVISTFGVPGMSIFKYSLVAFVIVVCEIVGRIRWKQARALAIFAVAISSFPVVWSSVLICGLIISGETPPIETEPKPKGGWSVRVEYPADMSLEFARRVDMCHVGMNRADMNKPCERASEGI